MRLRRLGGQLNNEMAQSILFRGHSTPNFGESLLFKDFSGMTYLLLTATVLIGQF